MLMMAPVDMKLKLSHLLFPESFRRSPTIVKNARFVISGKSIKVLGQFNIEIVTGDITTRQVCGIISLGCVCLIFHGAPSDRMIS